MATTTYKGLELQVTGTNSNTWGDTNNTDVINRIDQNLGGIVTKSLTNVNVSLTTDEARQAILRLTGTLTGNVQITSACQGFVFVENLTTGAFTITYTNGVAGVTIPAGRSTVIADATNGARIASSNDLVSGTVMLFVQTLAPTGWTKSAAHDNKALRIVSGTASSGGTTAFTTVFGARTIARANLPNVAPIFTGSSTSATTNKGVLTDQVTSSRGSGGSGVVQSANTEVVTSTLIPLGTIESLSGGVAQTTFDMAVQYLDAIVATRD